MTQSIPTEDTKRTRGPLQGIRHFLQSSIRNRLTVIVAGSALIPVVLVTIILATATYIEIRRSLTEEAFNKLSAVQTIKANQIRSYMEERAGDMTALSKTMAAQLAETKAKMAAVSALKQNQIVELFNTWDADVRDVASDPGVVAGMRDLTASFQEIGADQARSLYLGQGDLVMAQDGSLYSSAHFEQHGFFKGYTEIHGYEDAFLIDPAGNVVYSVHKKDVFGTNLVTGAYKDSNLAKLYQSLLKKKPGETSIADVATFEGANAMFNGTPIYDGTTLIGMLAYQLPLNKIVTIMSERTGLGVTSDTFLIAREDDGRITYRSNRTIVGDGKYIIGYDLTSIAPQFMQDALNGTTGGELVIGSVGEPVINSYRPLEVKGLTWAVLARVTAAEALSPTQTGAKKDFLTSYKESYGYYDIFLIEPKGLVFYTVAHEADYRSNILTGEYKDTNLGSLIAETVDSKSFEFADFAHYAPSGGEPAAFFAVPVLDENNNVEMIVAVQASLQQINAIMQESTGLGETGETYIVGQDQLRRTETRFLADLGVDTTILNPTFKVDTVASRSVLAGQSGQAAFKDSRGVSVMSVWSPFVLPETDTSNPEAQVWGVIAQIDAAESLAPVNQLAGAIALIIGLAMLVIGVLAVLIGTRFAVGFVRPILTLTDTATQVAAGNMNLSVKTETHDEIGTLSNAFNTMTSQLRDLIVGLEERVAARTKDLATVARISTDTATISDPEQMLSTAVQLTQRGFGLYHAHVFTYQKEKEQLQIVACGYKEGDEHKGTHGTTVIALNQEQSLVARAGRTRKPVIVNDVHNEPGWLPNPLLPDTRAELAVPMIVGDQLLGVLDVQSDKLDAFTDEDANIQMTLAAQIATSLQNAQSYTEAKARADLETIVNSIGQKIQRATTVEDTLQIAIRELGTAVGASRVKVSIAATRQNGGEETSSN